MTIKIDLLIEVLVACGVVLLLRLALSPVFDLPQTPLAWLWQISGTIGFYFVLRALRRRR
jgi:hypothetical protein